MISVCIASYEGSRFIEQQLKSILDQLSDADEVVISDDGSLDDTVMVVNRINDARIVWAGIGGRMGVVRNFERALNKAKGDYIFMADQDDVWLPGKVEACVEALKSATLVVTDCKVVDADLGEIAPSFFELRRSGAGLLRNIIVNSYVGCCMAFRRELLDLALPMPKGTPMHDMWLGLIAQASGSVTFIGKPYMLYRRHHHNATGLSGESRISLFNKIKYRMVLVALLARRLLLSPRRKCDGQA
jgi:glycosyltransferase involved in cell wall biosynthesis